MRLHFHVGILRLVADILQGILAASAAAIGASYAWTQLDTTHGALYCWTLVALLILSITGFYIFIFCLDLIFKSFISKKFRINYGIETGVELEEILNSINFPFLRLVISIILSAVVTFVIFTISMPLFQ